MINSNAFYLDLVEDFGTLRYLRDQKSDYGHGRDGLRNGCTLSKSVDLWESIF